jgi:hypothetical protein
MTGFRASMTLTTETTSNAITTTSGSRTKKPQ